MKRSLTAAAAAVLTGAGVVGSAGAALATPQYPAELPVQNGLAQTAFHGAGTVHGIQKTVGDVVSAPSGLAQQAGQQRDGGPLASTFQNGPLANSLENGPLNAAFDNGPLGGSAEKDGALGDPLAPFDHATTHPVPRSAQSPADGARAAQPAFPPRDIGDAVNTAGNAMVDFVNALPPEAMNQHVTAENGKPGKPGSGGLSGTDGQAGGSSEAINAPTTKPAPRSAQRPHLLDLSNANGMLG
ncbi:MAG: hypothetical protein IJH84_06345, partial [Saccharopolyspora sp.]|nr:hypothetical protein [Saccharopolyspora sp.]